VSLERSILIGTFVLSPDPDVVFNTVVAVKTLTFHEKGQVHVCVIERVFTVSPGINVRVLGVTTCSCVITAVGLFEQLIITMAKTDRKKNFIIINL